MRARSEVAPLPFPPKNRNPKRQRGTPPNNVFPRFQAPRGRKRHFKERQRGTPPSGVLPRFQADLAPKRNFKTHTHAGQVVTTEFPSFPLQYCPTSLSSKGVPSQSHQADLQWPRRLKRPNSAWKAAFQRVSMEWQSELSYRTQCT